MSGLALLDVAIGIVFIFLLLSLICSAFSEMLEAWLKNRATDLERGIRELLADPNGTGLVHEFYNHPLIRSLFEGSYNPAKVRKWMRRTNLPSYIPARNFALALMDTVLNATSNIRSGATGATTDIGAPGAALAPADGAVPLNTLKPLRAAIFTIGNTQIEQAMMTLVDAADDDAGKARENIEAWFNSSMDRVAGWYKRRTQVRLFFLGLVIAIVLNADSIAIIRSLALDPTLRNIVVAAAQEHIKNNPSPPSSPSSASTSPQPAPSSQPIVTSSSPASSSSLQTACNKDPDSPECKLEKNLEAVKKLGLPIGWNRNNPDTYPGTIRDPQNLDEWCIKAFGWLLTALALSLGAPFWFDLLNKFIVVRSTVKPHEKSLEEKSEG